MTIRPKGYEPREWVALALGAIIIVIQINHYGTGKIQGTKIDFLVFMIASFLMLSPSSLVRVLEKISNALSDLFKGKNESKNNGNGK